MKPKAKPRRFWPWPRRRRPVSPRSAGRSVPTAAWTPCGCGSPSNTSRSLARLAKEGNTLVVPANLSDLSSMLALASTIVKNDDTTSRGS